MKEFIEKLISRLEEYKESHLVEHDSEQCLHCQEKGVCGELDDCSLCIWDKATEMANQLADEYNNGWIACSERLPEDIVKDCLVTLENGAVFQASYSRIGQEFRMICWHGIERFSEENKVVAWQPLPQPYQPKKEPSTTKSWRQQAMSRFERVE